MKDTELNKVQRNIQTVGMKTFVDYYYDFEKLTVQEIIELFEQSESWTDNSNQTKASVGKAIFKEHSQKETLELISSSNADEDTIRKAKEIYKKEYPDWDRIKRNLQTVGMSSFVQYYYDFEKLTIQELIEKFERDKNWSENSKQTKASVGKNIFTEGCQKESLELVLSGKPSEDTINRAMEIYVKEYPKSEPKLIRFVRPEFTFGDNVVEKLFSNYTIKKQYPVCGGKYKLDWYIPELNLAIEFDESAHQQKITADKERQAEIEAELQCKFLRYKDY